MHINMCWLNPSNASEDKKCTSTGVDQIYLMPVSTQLVFKLVLTKPSHASAEKNQSQHVFTKSQTCQRLPKIYLNSCSPCQRGYKIYLNLCWQNTSHSREDTKCKLICVDQGQHGHTIFISTCVDKTPPMTARTQHLSLLVLTEPLPRQWRHKLHLIMCWLNPSLAREDRVNLSMCWPNPFHASEGKKHINKFWHNTSHANEHTKSTPRQGEHKMPVKNPSNAREGHKKHLNFVDQTIPGLKMYLNLWWSKPSYAREYIKYNSTCVDQTLICQLEHKIYRISYWGQKCISTCLHQTPHMPSRSQSATQIVSSKNNPCQQKHKIYLNMCWTNPFQASEDTNYITTCVEKTYPIPGRTQNLSLNVFTKPIPRP
jgi:hypothetical protein